ncbi:hypothetical protein B0A67_09880 [Flavobacterium aquidurense]|nr:hypothetical protein B0A67_09880 [Flavobacterium aquidurense]
MTYFVRLSEAEAHVPIGAHFSRSLGITQGDKKKKILKEREALALIEVEILLRRGLAEKIETDSRN